jgi:hypothetical protein
VAKALASSTLEIAAFSVNSSTDWQGPIPAAASSASMNAASFRSTIDLPDRLAWSTSLRPARVCSAINPSALRTTQPSMA